DDEQRVARLFPHQRSERGSLGLAHLANDVACDDEVGSVGFCEQRSRVAARVANLVTAILSQTYCELVQRFIGIEQSEGLKRRKSFGRRPRRRAGTGANVEQATWRKLGANVDERVQARDI